MAFHLLTWFALYTAPRAEKRASVDLVMRGFEIFLPTVIRWDRHGVRKAKEPREKVETPLFPRYLFVGLERPEEWGAARHADGVEAILGRPTRVDRAFLDELRTKAACGDFDETIDRRPKLEPGQGVTITSGPLTGWPAEVIELSDDDRVKLLFKGLGGGTLILGRDDIAVAA